MVNENIQRTQEIPHLFAQAVFVSKDKGQWGSVFSY